VIRIRETDRYRPRVEEAASAATLLARTPACDIAAFLRNLDPARDGAVFVEHRGALVGFAAFAGGAHGARLRWLAAAAHTHDDVLGDALLMRCVLAAARRGHTEMQAIATPAGPAAAWLADAGFHPLGAPRQSSPCLWQRDLRQPVGYRVMAPRSACPDTD
jgi:N-acetylglutamate synthase-like GNAT family acetyltransferase